MKSENYFMVAALESLVTSLSIHANPSMRLECQHYLDQLRSNLVDYETEEVLCKLSGKDDSSVLYTQLKSDAHANVVDFTQVGDGYQKWAIEECFRTLLYFFARDSLAVSPHAPLFSLPDSIAGLRHVAINPSESWRQIQPSIMKPLVYRTDERGVYRTVLIIEKAKSQAASRSTQPNELLFEITQHAPWFTKPVVHTQHHYLPLNELQETINRFFVEIIGIDVQPILEQYPDPPETDERLVFSSYVVYQRDGVLYKAPRFENNGFVQEDKERPVIPLLVGFYTYLLHTAL